MSAYNSAADSLIPGMIGVSDAMCQLRDLLLQVARSDRPVLVTGPTGSGKELAVHALHALGANRDEPLFDLNCSAFPESLTESLLFGHERGAFTGADRKQDGFFAAVGRGTLFLDEIGELPMGLQSKFLRVLETRTFRPIGASHSLKFEGRLVAATHVDLESRVARGTFREDLLYRLNVLEVSVPSLEERRSDIQALALHFVSKQRRSIRLSEGAMDALCKAHWPGSVRQLRNVIDRIAVLAPDDEITAEMVWTLMRSKKTCSSPLAQLVQSVLGLPTGDKLQLATDALIEEAMRLSSGNKTAAARMLGVHRKVVERSAARPQYKGSGAGGPSDLGER